MDHRERTAIPRLHTRHHVFTEEELAIYLIACGVRVEQFLGNLWRNSYAPNPITKQAWTPVHRWVPLRGEAVGYPTHAALAYRALAAEPVATTFPYTVFRDVSTYGEHCVSRHRARHIRRALARYQYSMLDAPDLLLAQGWRLVREAYARWGTTAPMSEATYRRHVVAMFQTRPPVVWAATSDGELCAYLTSYATGAQATLEKLYIAPAHRDGYVGVGMYWVALTGWGSVPAVRDVWAGGSMPGGVDQFKVSIGASLEQVPVHAGMRLPVRLGYRVLKPSAMSLKDLHA